MKITLKKYANRVNWRTGALYGALYKKAFIFVAEQNVQKHKISPFRVGEINLGLLTAALLLYFHILVIH